jgi:hypothetical protein
MAPRRIDVLIADRESVSDSLDYVKTELDRHVAAPITENVCEMLIGMINTAKSELLEVHRKIRHTRPADMDPHKIAFHDLIGKCTQFHSALHGIQMRFPVVVAAGPVVIPARTTDVRLPKLYIPTFDGNLLDWVSFRDIFSSTVGNSTPLSDANKLAHLKSLVTGEASRLIKSLILSDANYHIAWTALNERYNNDREFLFAILHRFMGQPNLQQPTATNLRSLVDMTQECIRPLSILAINLERGLDCFLLFLLTSKLDQSSRELWEQSLKDTYIPKLDDLFKFIEQRARALAAGVSVKSKPQQQQRTDDRRQIVKTHHSQDSTSYKLCNQPSHPLFKCSAFRSKSSSERYYIVKSNNLCFNCRQTGHGTSKCSSTGRCRAWQGKHHTLLHKDTSSATNPASTTTTNESQQKPSTSKKSSFHINEESTTVPSTILATALVNVTDG